MRIVAMVAVVAVLVAGGFWLARDRDTETQPVTTASADTAVRPADTTTEPAAAAATQPAGEAPPALADDPQEAEPAAEVGDPAVNEQAETAEQEQAGDSAPDLTPLLPVGYTPVEFVSDEPKRLFEGPEQVLESGMDYVALLHTNRGDMVVDLYEDLTPVTVNNFVFLALNRYYQGVPFHRVLEDFMAQTGDPTGTGSGGPGYQFADEIVEGLAFDSVGQLAMANAGPGTNGSQFFITFAATAWLTGAHTIFGEVMSGGEVLDALTRIDPSNPSAIVLPTDTVADLAAKGIVLPGADDATIEEALESILGTSPVMGQSFTAAGYRGVMGQMGSDPAYGFFPQPDTILDVVIGARPTQ